MLDANAKITSGLLHGQTNHFGDFEMCTDIKSNVKNAPTEAEEGKAAVVKIRGKYCLAHVEVQAVVPELRLPVHLLHGRGLFNSHLGNVSQIPKFTYLFSPHYEVL